MGEVYRARDPRLTREVAIKVLPASFSQDPDRLKRFEAEARAAGALNHPNITAVYDFGTHDGAPYIVTELLEGETLRSRLGPGAISPRKAIDYAVQIAKGLAAAHEKGIVHRDLKPENVFRDEGRAGQDPRLRPREAEAGRRRERPDGCGNGLRRHAAGRRARDDGLHVARAGARQAGGQAERPLLLRDDPLRDAVGPAGVPRRHGGGHDHGDPVEGAAGHLPDEQGRPPGPRPDRAALPGEEPGGALRVGPRRGVRSGVAVARFDSDGSDRPAGRAEARALDRPGVDRRGRGARRRTRGRVPLRTRRPASFRRRTTSS